MTIKIEITAENINGLYHQLADLLAGKTCATREAASYKEICETKAVLQELIQETPTPVPEEKKANKKAEKKPEPVKKEEAPVVQEAVVAEDFPATLDNCRVRIKEVCASDGKDGKSGGLDEAQKIITSFGVAKVGDLPKEKYADFIEECDKFLAKDSFKAKRGAKPSEELFA